jgi:hypothetical protein
VRQRKDPNPIPQRGLQSMQVEAEDPQDIAKWVTYDAKRVQYLCMDLAPAFDLGLQY